MKQEFSQYKYLVSFLTSLLMVDSCNYTFNILHYIVTDEEPINDNDMQRIWKEAFMATYKVLLK